MQLLETIWIGLMMIGFGAFYTLSILTMILPIFILIKKALKK